METGSKKLGSSQAHFQLGGIYGKEGGDLKKKEVPL
jgi:hypothetical protein